MDVPQVQPTSQSTPASGDRQSQAGGDLPFTAGQRFFARVIQSAGPGQAVLDLGGYRLLTSVPLDVAEGQVLHVAIRTVGPVIELTLESPPLEFSERAYALAAIRVAREAAAAGPGVTAAEIDRLLAALGQGSGHAAGRAGGTPAAQLARLLQPLALSSDAAALVDTLRARILQGGAALEHRAALATRTGEVGRVDDGLRGDLRSLLAALGRDTAGSPELESIRVRLMDDIVRRQLELAEHHLRDGQIRVDLPVLFGQPSAEAHLRIREDRERDGESGQRVTHTIALTVAHPELGPIHVVARLGPGDLHVRVAVADAAAAQALARLETDFTARLQQAGFKRVGVAIDVDPQAAAGPADPPDDPLPGGSILSALA